MTGLKTFQAATRKGTITYHVGPVCSARLRGFLVVVHGCSRSVMLLAEAFAEVANSEGFAVLVPVFDRETYGGFQILRGLGGPTAASDALNAACDDAAWRLGIVPAPVALVGFSGGAQFAHRYAMRFPERVTGLVAAAAGWYTMPNPRVAFPFGCGPSSDMPEGIQDLGAFLRIPTRVMVGDRDVERDKHLRTSRAVDEEQGLHRFERAHRWVDALSRSAMDRGIRADIALEVLAGCGHSAAAAIRNGALVQRSVGFLASHLASHQSAEEQLVHG
jgi:pimeloyl-ACP methyl ester carboxylesterase